MIREPYPSVFIPEHERIAENIALPRTCQTLPESARPHGAEKPAARKPAQDTENSKLQIPDSKLQTQGGNQRRIVCFSPAATGNLPGRLRNRDETVNYRHDRMLLNHRGFMMGGSCRQLSANLFETDDGTDDATSAVKPLLGYI